MIKLRRLKADDSDLADLAAQLNSPDWDGSVGNFSAASLREFLSSDHHIYLVAYLDGQLAGASHAYVMFHPGNHRYFYIDEVDTLPDHQRQGVATAMMKELLKLAEHYGAEEAWLGADEGNEAAYALYRSLKPSEEEPGVIFTYKLVRE